MQQGDEEVEKKTADMTPEEKKKKAEEDRKQSEARAKVREERGNYNIYDKYIFNVDFVLNFINIIFKNSDFVDSETFEKTSIVYNASKRNR